MDALSKDLQDFNKLHPNRKLAVFGLVLFVFVLSILIGMYFSQTNRPGSSNSRAGSQNQVTQKTTMLALVPSAETVKVGSTVKVSVMLDGEAVPASDIVVTYDPAYFAVADKDIQVGTAFKSLPYKKVQNGRIAASAIVDLNSPSDVKTGEVLSITLEALKAGSSPLGFDIDTKDDVQKTITSRIGGIDTLKSAQGTTITIE
ncbi:hypothetical protein A3F32_01260 [Candidatus Roizmanbacteria bacterium RIFCSPHIGHO2_12_FULL_42_10]|uniref:Uncharacterized protein n=1 Tax=Candidatus Roizmanbacteria bacterium RIFCSPHIGHO2_12_FULL_42_10 TaxID=1802053 RepID=A0A1F7I3T5_9BACT|nr:MAG: hypothetical protein A3F32_01260 [Candidatus Roizmanbacteria bacterium RIFCSPHIGHO2_12_FULL_42_10]